MTACHFKPDSQKKKLKILKGSHCIFLCAFSTLSYIHFGFLVSTGQKKKSVSSFNFFASSNIFVMLNNKITLFYTCNPGAKKSNQKHIIHFFYAKNQSHIK